MNDYNKRGKREALSDNRSLWDRYEDWVEGMERGQRIRYRVLQVATVISLLIIMLYLMLSTWIKMPSVPDMPSFGGDPSGDFSQAEAPGVVNSGRKEGVFTFLLAGKDVISGGTDTMLLLTYDTQAKTIHGLNLPRDTMINVSTRSKRLNTVYNYNKGKDKATQVEKGMTALKKEVANLTGITPDYYVLVEWKAIGELVDALGGVEFNVPFNMDYDDPAQNLHIHQKAGLRKLNGDDAMQVIRHRKNNDGSHSSGDVGRVKIQQDFLKAVAKKCLQPATFLKIPELAEVFTDNVSTDLTVGNIIALAQKAMGMDPESGVTFVTAPIASSFKYQGAALITLDRKGMLEIVNSGMNPYKQDIQDSDLRLVYRNKNGSFGVTNGTLADPKMGNASASNSGSSSKPKPEEPPEPENPDIPMVPLEPSSPADPTAPVDPAEPADPTVPVDPVEPVDPTDPTVPGDPAEPGDGDQTDPVLPPEGGDAESNQGGSASQEGAGGVDEPDIPAGGETAEPDPAPVTPDPAPTPEPDAGAEESESAEQAA